MRRRRFCSACGEPIKTKSFGFPALGQLCARCSPQFRRERALLIGAFLLCLTSVFEIARYTAPSEPFSFIGTPVASNADNLAASTGAPSFSGANDGSSRAQREPLSTESPRSPESICGAPTKSGRPCQRRVKDGGYCWQHRDRFGAKSPSLDGR